MSAHLPTVIFSHANSFPASTYRVMLADLRRRGLRVKYLEKLGHDPRYPVSNNWPHLVEQLAEFVRDEAQQSGQAPFLMGHSLGGFLSIMVAAHHPELAHGVLLMDSPLLGGWRATGVGLVKGTRLFNRVSPSAVSRKRRYQWPNAEAALEHFLHKKAFARWDDRVLRDYVEHSMHAEDGHWVLSFRREVESDIYDAIPNNLEPLFRRHPLKCPVAFIGGLKSQENQQVGMTLTQKITRGRITFMDGSHLFPMEQPLATAAAIEAALLNLHQVKLRKAAADRAQSL